MIDSNALQAQVNDEVARLIGRQTIDLITLQTQARMLVDRAREMDEERARLKEWADALARAAPGPQPGDPLQESADVTKPVRRLHPA